QFKGVRSKPRVKQSGGAGSSDGATGSPRASWSAAPRGERRPAPGRSGRGPGRPPGSSAADGRASSEIQRDVHLTGRRDIHLAGDRREVRVPSVKRVAARGKIR